MASVKKEPCVSLVKIPFDDILIPTTALIDPGHRDRGFAQAAPGHHVWSVDLELVPGCAQQLGTARFQSLGSIQCMNGTLRADSYTASGCRFINEPLATTDQRKVGLGARMDFSNASASVNWFNQNYELAQPGLAGVNQPIGATVLDGSLLSPTLANPLVAGFNGEPMQYLNSETSGVDLNFKVGVATTNSGDIQLGLAFTHVLDAEFQGLYPDCDLGAMPPFGELYGQRTFIDEMLREEERIAFHAGDHRTAVEMSYSDFERLCQPVPADLSGPLRERV